MFYRRDNRRLGGIVRRLLFGWPNRRTGLLPSTGSAATGRTKAVAINSLKFRPYPITGYEALTVPEMTRGEVRAIANLVRGRYTEPGVGFLAYPLSELMEAYRGLCARITEAQRRSQKRPKSQNRPPLVITFWKRT